MGARRAARQTSPSRSSGRPCRARGIQHQHPPTTSAPARRASALRSPSLAAAQPPPPSPRRSPRRRRARWRGRPGDRRCRSRGAACRGRRKRCRPAEPGLSSRTPRCQVRRGVCEWPETTTSPLGRQPPSGSSAASTASSPPVMRSPWCITRAGPRRRRWRRAAARGAGRACRRRCRAPRLAAQFPSSVDSRVEADWPARPTTSPAWRMWPTRAVRKALSTCGSRRPWVSATMPSGSRIVVVVRVEATVVVDRDHPPRRRLRPPRSSAGTSSTSQRARSRARNLSSREPKTARSSKRRRDAPETRRDTHDVAAGLPRSARAANSPAAPTATAKTSSTVGGSASRGALYYYKQSSEMKESTHHAGKVALEGTQVLPVATASPSPS